MTDSLLRHVAEYYSPDKLNPVPPKATGRPASPDNPVPLEQDPLPLWDKAPQAQAPQELWRGVTLNMGQPGLEGVREVVKGTGPNDMVLFPRDPAPNSPEVGRMVLDYLDNPGSDRGLGTHWSQNHQQATDFTGQWPVSDDPVQYALNEQPENALHVRLKTDWGGLGEDPTRHNTDDMGDGSTRPREKEITMLPGAPMNVSDVQTRKVDDDGYGVGKWRSVLDESQQRRARLTNDHSLEG